MTTKQWCSGAEQLAPLKGPTSLVDCPVCARKNLGSRFDRYDYAIAHVGGAVGIVPPHTAHALRPEQIPTARFVSATHDRDVAAIRAYLDRRDDVDV